MEPRLWRDESSQLWIGLTDTEGKKEDRRAVMKFHFGRIYSTENAMIHMVLWEVDPLELMIRHVSGDYGDLTDHDIGANEDAIKYGTGRILSSYKVTENGDKIWIITDFANGPMDLQNITTILLPEDN